MYIKTFAGSRFGFSCEVNQKLPKKTDC